MFNGKLVSINNMLRVYDINTCTTWYFICNCKMYKKGQIFQHKLNESAPGHAQFPRYNSFCEVKWLLKRS